MDKAVERELIVPETPEEVWRSLAEPGWLGDDAQIELHPAGEVRAGERSGFVEEADEPRRLVFWWSAPTRRRRAWSLIWRRPMRARGCA